MTFEEAGVTMAPVVLWTKPALRSLDRLIEERANAHASFSDQDLAWILIQTCFALKNIHDAGKVCINLKPQDVFVSGDSQKTVTIENPGINCNPDDFEARKQKDVIGIGGIIKQMSNIHDPPSTFEQLIRKWGVVIVESDSIDRPGLNQVLAFIFRFSAGLKEGVHDMLIKKGIFALISKAIETETCVFGLLRDVFYFGVSCLTNKPAATEFSESGLLDVTACCFNNNFKSIVEFNFDSHLNALRNMLWCLINYCELLNDEDSVRIIFPSNVVLKTVAALDEYGVVVTNGYDAILAKNRTKRDADEFVCMASMLLARIMLAGTRTAPNDINSFQSIFAPILPSLLRLFHLLDGLLSLPMDALNPTSASAPTQPPTNTTTDSTSAVASTSSAPPANTNTPASVKVAPSRFFCDGCQASILPSDRRYHCLVCEDFDLCDGCYCAEIHEKTHDILLYPKSEEISETVFLNRFSPFGLTPVPTPAYIPASTPAPTPAPASAPMPASTAPTLTGSLPTSCFTPNQFHLQTRIELALAIACLLRGVRPEAAAFPGTDEYVAVMAALCFLRGWRGERPVLYYVDSVFKTKVETAWAGVVDAEKQVKEYLEGKK